MNQWNTFCNISYQIVQSTRLQHVNTNNSWRLFWSSTPTERKVRKVILLFSVVLINTCKVLEKL